MKNKNIIIAVAVVVCVVAAGIAYIFNRKHNVTVAASWETTDVESQTDESEITTEAEYIYVYVCGQVNSPGVVSLTSGARIYEAIEAAGGMTGEAQVNAVNQAELVIDGQMIYVPGIDEEYVVDDDLSGDGLVNINTAGVDELMTLPGIGESRANAIIDYRESAGDFVTIEDIMQVSGIKDSAFGKIKDYIKV